MADEGRHIDCFRCGSYLGIIRDARLRKDAQHACGGCVTALKAADLAMKTKPKMPPNEDFVEGFFGDLFGKRR